MSQLPKILHVEDDPDIQEIAKLALEIIGGLEVAQCSSGQEALKVAEAFAPDIFLLDVMMPGMSGEETLANLRKIPSLAEVPAIFMTAKAQSSEVTALLALGAVEVITKPFDPMQLADKIISVWRKTL